jgi:hypothetical protein
MKEGWISWFIPERVLSNPMVVINKKAQKKKINKINKISK